MTEYEYDEEESARLHMDVVYEIEPERPTPVARWVEAMRALNRIDDPLARKLLLLHRGCGSGSGECDEVGDRLPIAETREWPCRTTETIADYFGVKFPTG